MVARDARTDFIIPHLAPNRYRPRYWVRPPVRGFWALV